MRFYLFYFILKILLDGVLIYYTYDIYCFCCWMEFASYFKTSDIYVISASANNLWKGLTSISNAGRKKGRGKLMKKTLVKDLNVGQKIGFGKY